MAKRAPKVKGILTNLRNRWMIARIGLFLLVALMMYVSMFDNVVPESLDVNVSEPAPEDIRSPVTVEHESQTAAREREAAETIDAVYMHRPDYAQMQAEKVNAIFDLTLRLKEEMAEEEDNDADPEEESPSLEDQVSYMEDVLSQNVDQSLSTSTLEALLRASDEQLTIARDVVQNAVHEVMDDEIPVSEVPAARDEAEENLSRSVGSIGLQNAIVEIARHMITANYIYDDEATMERREEALSAIDPVFIREGQLLVEEGAIVSAEAYEQMEIVGLLDDRSSYFPYFALFLFIGLMILLLALYIAQTSSPLRKSNRSLFLYVIVIFIMLMMMKIMSLLALLEVHGIIWLTPVALGPMLLAQLLNYRLALFSCMLFAVCGSIIFNENAASTFHSTFTIYVLLSGYTGVFFLGKNPRLVKVLRAGVFVSLVNVTIVTVFHMFSSSQFLLYSYGAEVSFALMSGFLAAVLTLGFTPFFETGFNILSPTKLIELSNANHPLLRKILLEAPGTYHHSVMVGNLSESACEAIGADGLLARVGAYYHDLGKTKSPMYFIENQMQMENPHDHLSPSLSAKIIIDHPYDGAEILKDHHMPKKIIDFAKQHHGTSLLKYFFYKAKKDGLNPEEDAYRYPGPKAQFKESAVVGIADSVEAAVRSMQNPNPDKIKEVVKTIIRERLVDGQFDECDITVRELAVVADSICETLQGTFHSRIEYPEEKK